MAATMASTSSDMRRTGPTGLPILFLLPYPAQPTKTTSSGAIPACATVRSPGTALPSWRTARPASLGATRLPTTWAATLCAAASTVSVSSTSTSWVTKSPSNIALTGTGWPPASGGCGSGAPVSWVSVIVPPDEWADPSCGRLRGVRLGPPVAVCVIPHDLRREPHPAQDSLHRRRLDVAAEQALDHRRVVQGVAVLPPDLAAGPRAEVIGVAVVLQGVAAHRVLVVSGRGGGADGQVAQVAQPRQRLREGELHPVVVDVVDDHVPDPPELPLPLRVLLVQPVALLGGDAALRLPPHGRAPVPHAEVERVVPGVQPGHELIPVPGPLEPVVADLVDELVGDPLVHELLVGLLAHFQRGVVVHAGAGEDGEQPRRGPERLVDDPLRAARVVLDQDLQGGAALLGVAGLVR